MSASELETTQSYEPEEIQQILQLAIARQDYQQEGELSREQLWEIAAELNISGECVQAAEQDWLEQKLTQTKRQAFDAYRQEQLKHRIVKYAIVNTFFLTLNFVSVHNFSWSLYILLIWGLFISLNIWKTYQNKGEEYEQAFRSWERRHELKQTFTTLWDSIRKAWET